MKLRFSGALWLVLALAVFLCWPLTTVFWFDSHEGREYVTRTVDYAEAFRHGELYPRWLPSLYGGYGSPFANFYAPTVYWLAGMGTLLTHSPTLALKLVVVLGALLAAGSSFALLYEETRRQEVAFLGACLYTTAPYRLAEVGWRGDLAEHLALGMLPLALFAYRRIVRAPTPTAVGCAALLAALAHAGLVMSHTVMGLWGTGVVAVLILCSAYSLARDGAFSRAVPLGVAFVAALLVASIYTLPALLEKSFVRTESMVVANLAPENNALTWDALFAPGAHRIGPLLLCASLVVGLGWWLRREPSTSALLWLSGALAFAMLTLPVASPLWAAHVIPFGDYIQFPWRLLGPANLCAALALAVGWGHALPARRVAALASAPLVLAAVFVGLPQTELRPMPPEQVLLSSERIARLWIRGTVIDEYLPRVVTETARAPAARVAESTPTVNVRIQKSAGTEHVLALDVQREGGLELNLHAFPGWKVTTQEGPVHVRLTTSERGLVSLHVPAPGHYVAVVDFGSTPARLVALALCWLGLLSVWPLAWLVARRLPRCELTGQTAASMPPVVEAP